MQSKSRGSSYSIRGMIWISDSMVSKYLYEIVAEHKFEHTWVRVGLHKTWEDHSVKLLRVSIDSKLKFDKHVFNIIKEASAT